jgi:hypothetical protein
LASSVTNRTTRERKKILRHYNLVNKSQMMHKIVISDI